MVQELKLFATEQEAEAQAYQLNAEWFSGMVIPERHYVVGMTLDLDSYIIMVYDADGKFVDYWREE